jgi:murein DD-endopeptidase MepM/ murein hydrolase activator NlpD
VTWRSAASPTATSFLTVYPSGSPRPNASNLNLRGGVDVANVVVMKLGTDGKVRFYNDAGTTDVVVDVVGWFPAASGFSAVAPRRLFDSRQGAPFVAGEKRTVSLGDSKATAAVLNVTAVDGSETSFVTVWPSGPQPTVSSLNPTAGNATANLVVVGLAADGTFQLANAAGRQHLIVDLLGTFVGGTGFHPVTPVRALDTRPTIRSGRDVRHGFPIAASTNVAYAHTHSAYTATDVFAACGTPLLSPVDGVISEVRRIDAYDAEVRNPATLGGRSVAIVGDDGVRYYGSHFDTIDDSTTVGRRVEVGTRIGTMGRTGDTTVCHLHMGLSPACPGPEWSVRRGVIWPWPYLDAWRAGQNMSPQAEIAAWTDANPRGCLDAMRDPNASKASGP